MVNLYPLLFATSHAVSSGYAGFACGHSTVKNSHSSKAAAYRKYRGGILFFLRKIKRVEIRKFLAIAEYNTDSMICILLSQKSPEFGISCISNSQ